MTAHLSVAEFASFGLAPLLLNMLKTAWWFSICSVLLFWLIGFSHGPPGATISSWLTASMIDARLTSSTGLIPLKAEKNVFAQFMKGVEDAPQLWSFLASISVLYGAAPLAVAACIFRSQSLLRRSWFLRYHPG